ncbi:hypothetical protein HU200_053494 [Digitaria exilis]|uniref:Uncharacterized protein n=1 Tax=Digitaria exilis TaxID=1010633 RepID=A0A835AJY5_9POAL|nr:hypothetical protein HU200_053494 [Digitaria exilis]
MVAAEGCRMSVGWDCLQQTMAARVSVQLPVRCGTMSKDGACGIGFMGQLGLQRAVAVCSFWLGFPVRYMARRRR